MPATLSVLQNLTVKFIEDDPTPIVLVPTSVVKTPGKGVSRVAGTPRTEANYKVIWPDGDGVLNTEDGSLQKFNLVLVGTYDCECQVGDTWEVDGRKYIVTAEHPFNGYERKFGLVNFGGEPGG